MLCRALILLGAVFIYHQDVAGEMFLAEIMVESIATLETSTIISKMKNITSLLDKSLQIQEIELTTDCLLLGDSVTCNCGPDYTWSNDVCYSTLTCCTDDTCTKPVTQHSPICIPKVKVQIIGTVTMSSSQWDSVAEQKLLYGMKQLNGLETLNVTMLQSDYVADFEANVSVVFKTAKLLEVLADLELNISASITMDTIGLVEMKARSDTVRYESSPILTCSFNEVTSVALWSMSRGADFGTLGNGSVVQITKNWETPNPPPSFLRLTLVKVNRNWAGNFKCVFSEGSVRHTAQQGLAVALLPDTIEMRSIPLSVDCVGKTESDSVAVMVTAVILNSTEDFHVSWCYRDKVCTKGYLKPDEIMDTFHYTFTVEISCKTSDQAHTVSITFKNSIGQKKNASLDITALYPDSGFCEEDLPWPRTPDGATLFNRTCGVGRVGFSSRTCRGRVWQDVYFQCVSEKLNNIQNIADNFKQGFGATQDIAEEIFAGLKNSSTSSGSTEDIADLSASINVLGTMSQASGYVALDDSLLPNLIFAASNMVNQSWEGVNTSIQQSMSSDYLESMEGLVQNIKANNSKGVNSDNVQLDICDSLLVGDCAPKVFGVVLNLNNSQGIMKTMAVKNLAEKLRNNYKDSEVGGKEYVVGSLVVSATLQTNNTSQLGIKLVFPREYPDYHKVSCVFWNITSHEWSDEGCQLESDEEGNITVCSCNHLTPFSAMMSKTVLILPFLEDFTNVGLGVSICALLLFLIIEALVWSAVVKSNLSHFRHTSLVNISVSLLLADVCYIVSSDPDMIGPTVCLVLTVCKHFFYLTMFFWMLCLSVMLVHQLIFVFNPLRKRVFMFFSSIVGYVVPMLIVGCSYVYYEYTGGEYMNEKTCWLNYKGLLKGSMHAFVLPVGAVILTNLFSMCVVILTLTKTGTPDSSKSDKDTAKSILKVVLFLTPAFGITWIVGFILLILGDLKEDTSIDGTTQPFLIKFFTYAFTILNSFQGLFIFLAGVFAEQRVREEVLKLILAKTSSGEKSEKKTTITSIN